MNNNSHGNYEAVYQRPVGDYRELLRQGTRIRVEKGFRIVNSQKKLEYVYYLESGVVALVSLMEDGDERVFRYHKRGELLGIFQLYNTVPSLKNAVLHTVCPIYDSVTKTECIVYRFDPQVVLKFLFENPELLVEQVRRTAKINMVHCFRYSKMLKNRVPNILCEMLLEFAHLSDGEWKLDKYFSNAEIARYLGVHVVTVGKILSKMKEEGLVDRRDGQLVILDREQLEEYSGEKNMKY